MSYKVSRREILREQVFEALFQSDMIPERKLKYSEMLNELFAGEFRIEINKSIAFVDFENSESYAKMYVGRDIYAGNKYCLDTIHLKSYAKKELFFRHVLYMLMYSTNLECHV